MEPTQRARSVPVSESSNFTGIESRAELFGASKSSPHKKILNSNIYQTNKHRYKLVFFVLFLPLIQEQQGRFKGAEQATALTQTHNDILKAGIRRQLKRIKKLA